jgi:hypothetical protein
VDDRERTSDAGGDASLNVVGGHCPVCGQEYRPGFTTCADDGAVLEAGPAPVGDASGNEDEPEELPDLGPHPTELGAWPLRDALLLAGRLRSEGIPALTGRDHEIGPYLISDVIFQSLVPVLVAAEDVERAREIVLEIQST